MGRGVGKVRDEREPTVTSSEGEERVERAERV